ncbi:hypothetical protein [Streptomyces sp. NPDC018347]
MGIVAPLDPAVGDTRVAR